MIAEKVILGVSLSNSAFDRQFARRLAAWLCDAGAAQIHVVLFDAIETINYSVFRQLSFEDAQKASLRRAKELYSMFERSVATSAISHKVELESASEIHRSDLFNDVLSDLRSAYERKAEFYRDVRSQVFTNLAERRKKHGDDFIEEHMDTLAQYVIEEVAFFYTYFRKDPEAIEVYPGPSLIPKNKFFDGLYWPEVGTERLPARRRFVDVSFLLAKPDALFDAA
jgi:tRNA-dependent cyclodipeptide synthase